MRNIKKIRSFTAAVLILMLLAVIVFSAAAFCFADSYYDVDPGFSVDPQEKLLNILAIGAGVGVFAGAVSLIIVLVGMKSVRKATRAVNYLDRNSFKLSIMRDIFLYRSTTKTKIQKQQPNNGPGKR